MHLGANVLLPEGWDTHPDARYPLFINHASSGVLPAEAGSVTRNCNGSGLGSWAAENDMASAQANNEAARWRRIVGTYRIR